MPSSPVLVTGGAGFIGSNLARALLRRGHQVRVLDNFSTGRPENLADIAGDVTVLDGDIRDTQLLDRAVAGCELVFHEAALPSVPRSIEAPVETDDVNVHGTLLVLDAARRHGVRRVVYAASSSAYGETEVLPKVETMRPEPISPYAVSKLAGEMYMQVFHRCYGLETVCLRYFNVFGPHQDPNSEYAAVIPRFITAALAGKPPTVFGDGLQSRDFCYIDNAVEANLKAADADGAAGRVFNVACATRTTLLEVVAEIGRILGRSIEPVHEAERPGDIRHSEADIGAARSVLGYTGAIDFAEGLRRTVAWFQKQGATAT